MVYLAGFLTVVMHAGLVTEPRYGLVERARNTFLRDVQHVIVHGGTGSGSLTIPPNQTGLTLAEAWNATWGRGSKTSQKQRRLHPSQPAATALLVNESPDIIDHDEIGSVGGEGLSSLATEKADATTARRQLITVSYPDSPGCTYLIRPNYTPLTPKNCKDTPMKFPTYLQIGKYAGAQKTVVGIWLANKTWPNTAWTMVIDDDNVLLPSRLAVHLKELDPFVPLLLAGRVGPGRDVIPCLPAGEFGLGPGTPSPSSSSLNASQPSPRPRWGCCSDPSQACRSQLTHPDTGEALSQSMFTYDKGAKTMVRKLECTELRAECCRTEAWPEGVKYRYPYKVSPDGHDYRPHFIELWPFGGEGYALSSGMLNAIDERYWEKCMYGLQCANADHRVMTCVANAGFSVTKLGARFHGKFPTLRHHVREPSGSCWSTYTVEEKLVKSNQGGSGGGGDGASADTPSPPAAASTGLLPISLGSGAAPASAAPAAPAPHLQADIKYSCVTKAQAAKDERPGGVWDTIAKPSHVHKKALEALEKFKLEHSRKGANTEHGGGGGSRHGKHHHHDHHHHDDRNATTTSASGSGNGGGGSGGDGGSGSGLAKLLANAVKPAHHAHHGHHSHADHNSSETGHHHHYDHNHQNQGDGGVETSEGTPINK